MGFETGHSSPEEQERAKKAYREADPTSYSTLPPQGELMPAGSVRYTSDGYVKEKNIVEHEGDIFYELDQNSSFQQAVTRYLKGIVNVSDVIAVQRENDVLYYSKHMQLDNVAEKESPDEIIADKELIQLIFADLDHIVPTDSKKALNMRVEDSKVAFYDFGGSTFYADTDTQADWRVRSDVPKGNPKRELSRESLDRLHNKLAQLKERYVSDEGRIFAEEIYNSLQNLRQEKSFDVSFDSFYAILEKRIIGSIQYIDTLIAEKEHQQAA